MSTSQGQVEVQGQGQGRVRVRIAIRIRDSVGVRIRIWIRIRVSLRVRVRVSVRIRVGATVWTELGFRGKNEGKCQRLDHFGDRQYFAGLLIEMQTYDMQRVSGLSLAIGNSGMSVVYSDRTRNLVRVDTNAVL